MKKPVIFSGIQPTGNLHLGNYLGAIKNWVELQNSGKYQCFFSIVDYHALTGNDDAQTRHDNIIQTAAELLAVGLDPDKSVFYIQSHIPEHTELAWILGTVSPMAELERMTQYKDKSQQQVKNINAGLFTYPILQASDILLYHGQLVPVGQDQVQHIELTRDIARRFNQRYGKYFPETKALLTEVPKVTSLLEPTKKMSKSLGDGHTIDLADEPKVIEKKLKKAVTASQGGGQAPGVTNLLLLLEKFADKKVYNEFVKAEKTGNIRYGDLKIEVGQAVSKYFTNFRVKRQELLANHNQLAEVLIAGADKARPVAEKTMAEVRKFVGVR